jgi:hypothetical protein
MDRVWWDHYMEEVKQTFTGSLYSHGHRPDVKRVNGVYFKSSNQNSGAGAVVLAAEWGAKEIILLGYDCQFSGGKRHWHGDHPAKNRHGKGMGNAGSMNKWPEQFRKALPYLRGAKVINASRETALKVFPRMPLEDVLT